MWSCHQADGILAFFAATLTAASVAFLPDGNVRSTLIFVLDPVCLFGAASLGVGLQVNKCAVH